MDIITGNVGWIEVICGPMFSGKSEELIRRLRRAMIARKRVEVFKPLIDNRYSDNEIVSHGDLRMNSQVVSGATEIIDHTPLDAFGGRGRSEQRKTGYAVEIRQIRPGQFAVHEYRDLNFSQEVSASHPLAHGLGALALIFHPFYSGDFAMNCEGVGTWNGRPAWQVHFKQRPDKPSELHSYRADRNIYDADLKGRAFIGLDNYEILHLETDVMEPLPQIGLAQEHMSVDYEEVGFPARATKFWIPSKAELFINLHGHLHHLKHSFTNFILFSVDASEQQQAPKQAPPKPEQQDPEQNR